MADITTRDREHDARGRRAHRARTERWAIILAGGDGARLRDLTRRIAGDDRPKQFCSLLGEDTLLDHALPDLSRAFLPLRRFLGTHMEAAVAEAAYERLASADFSRGVLGPNPSLLAVLPVRGVEWSDLGHPERVLARRGTMLAPWAEFAPSAWARHGGGGLTGGPGT